MSQRNEINTNLRLDRIVASQPELGPSIPDGGYGWIVLIASIFLQIFIPSIISSYGIFMLYSRIEGSALSDDPTLWDIALLPTPITFMAFLTLADPWSRTIVASSTWPRLVTTAGICLTCAGQLIQWVTMRDMLGTFLYMFAGALSGFGSSLALTQSEILISQYFRLKLLTVNNILVCAYALGFIIVPIILGYMLYKRGILHSLLIYQAIILQCIILISVFKKPVYLKAERRRYALLQNASEDDEMIFAKDEPVPETNTASTSTPNENQSTENKKSNYLKDSFSVETHQNTIQNSSDQPRPIFSEVEITANANTYSFDHNEINSVDDNNVTILAAVPERITSTNFKQEISFLWKWPFYKSLFFLISIKYSILIFWSLFPTYLYVEMDKLHIQQTTFLVGSMGLGSLFIGLFSSFFPIYGKNKLFVAAGFCLLSSVGYFILSDAGSEGWLLFGALLITSSITALHALHTSTIKYMLRNDNERAHTLLHTLAGICILFLLVQDASYRNCFRIMSLLQLVSGILFLYNLIYSYFVNIFSRT